MARIATLIVLLASFSVSAWSLDKIPFNEQQFADFQASGIPVLVDVYAKWCPTCERQQIILKRYFKENPTSPIRVMVVDFDDQKQWVTYFRAPRQSSLFIYQHNKQQWFSVAETRTHMIEAEFSKYLLPLQADTAL